ncbi:uncharacterized protein LOC132302637 [Cornus florida]|uniref:uncharacterized protein LOC132302637 n=1 Tax=Cornus florida TaxID=4283 RepID=UPI0028A15436|nr:uncharacterized protein LOC132302637 [Cornus florida]
MASDKQAPSRHKHRRSSDDESEEPSKRRKHHRHRHHRHRHSSRKHEEDQTIREEEIKPDKDEIKHDEREDVALPPLEGAVSGSNWQPDYEMEEGEIVEDEDFGGVDTDVVKKATDSDAEFVGVMAAEVHVEFDNHNMGVQQAQDEVGLYSGLPPEDNLDISGQDSKAFGDNKSDDELLANTTVNRKEKMITGNKIHDEAGVWKYSSVEQHANGDVRHKPIDVYDRPHTGSGSPVKGSRKRKSYRDNESGIRDQIKSVSSENTGERHKALACSSSRDSYHEEIHSGKRSKSHDRNRERSRSRSILQETSFLKTTHQQDAACDTKIRKTMSDSDDDEVVGRNGDRRHGSRELFRDKERERSSSYSRYTERVDRHHSLEIRDRDRARTRDIQDRDVENSQETRDRDRRREKERLRDREWDRERERERERERAREKGRDRERERERERAREKGRDRERERGRGRDSGRDRNRSKDRDSEVDGVSRHHKYENVGGGFGDRDRYNDLRHRRDVVTDHRDRARTHYPERAYSSKNHHSEGYEDKLKRDEDEQEDYQERISLQLEVQEEEDLNRIKEESRRRRQAILEKYKAQQHVPHPEDTAIGHETDMKHVEQSSLVQTAVNVVPEVTAINVVPEVLDGRSDADTEPSFSVGKSPPQNGISAFERTSSAKGLGEGTPKSERSDDMFCDDIFGESPAGVRKTGKADGLAIERSGLHDNWDDAEGYYSYRFGEILDGRYEVTAAHGKGVFSTVVRAKDLKAGAGDPDEVAIKIIRNNETMYKAGLEELVILKKLVGADPEDRRHCVRFLSSFKYRNHLCLVFESLHMNLREVLKKFGRNIGLKLTAVRAYAKQLFIALKHLRNCGVLHSDIKPDNMLVNEGKNVLKLCDFGNAMFAGKNEITPYLVSRFYRAPEIILGLPYDHPLDIWSVGCCLFEIYTGKVLFPGPTNNDMLRLHMELKGPFPKKMLRKGAFTHQHFDQDLNFLASEEDPVTKKAIKRLILNIKPKDIGTIVTTSPGEDPKMLSNFKDLLEKVFVLDPDKRITVSQALNHPFITGK